MGIMTHNITTLTGQVYDTLAHNTNNEQFNQNDIDLTHLEVDEVAGKIYIGYNDKEFEITISEKELPRI